MSKSLIRKNQLHPDIADLISGYGSSFFIPTDGTPTGVVTINGDQIINGSKDFSIRPTISGGLPIATIFDSTEFNGNRKITRTSFPVGLNVSGDNVVSFLNNLFFPFLPATISLNSYPLQEFGTIYGQVPFDGTITQNSETSLTSLQFISNNTVIGVNPFPNFGNFSSGFQLNLDRNTILGARITVGNNGNPVQISGLRNIIFEAPSYAGSGINNLQTNPSNMKIVLSSQQQGTNNGKSLFQKPFSRRVQVYTNNNWFYFVYPFEWGPLSSISNPQLGAFNISDDFITGSVNLTLANNNLYLYRFYKSLIATTLTDYPVDYNF